MRFKYNNARTLFATGQLDWLTDGVRLVLLSDGYTPNEAHLSMADVPPSSVIDTSDLLTGKTVVNGYCRSATPEFELLTAPQPIGKFVLRIDSLVVANQLLLHFTDEGYGVPFIAVGFDYAIAHDQGTGWFRL